MEKPNELLARIFEDLDQAISRESKRRTNKGLAPLGEIQIILLGQMSLMIREDIYSLLSLTQTADLDAKIKMDPFVKAELKKRLEENGLTYDEDSHLIWVPEDSVFDRIYSFLNFEVLAIDPESALLSKAIKAIEKNKVLIREAIASGHFPNLVKRILKHGGKLEDFL